jgi:hypothetical protein
MAYKFTRQDCIKGAKAVAKLPAPTHCPICHKEYPPGTTFAQHRGHLGLHGLADNHFGGDIKAAQRHLRNNGLARQDPAPWNGAWPEYEPISSPGKGDEQ